MGQEGKIVIVNKTRSKMIQTFSNQDQMATWDFQKEIQPNHSSSNKVEWSEKVWPWFDKSKDHGEVGYKLDNNKNIKISLWNAKERNILVELWGFDGPGSSTSYRLAWQKDSDMFATIEEKTVDLKKWMDGINPTTPINKLCIPGTHDSLTFEPSGFVSVFAEKSARAQYANASIDQQLYYGCRYLDLRINEDLDGCHGIVNCKNGLEYAISKIHNFLDNFRSETVFVRIKNDRTISDWGKFEKNMDDLIRKHQSIFWKNNTAIKWPYEWPTLNDVKGKLIVIDSLDEGPNGTRYFCGKGYGYKYNQKIDVGTVQKAIFAPQDDYDAPNENNKLKEIKDNINLPYDASVMKLNHVSATGTAAGAFGLGWTPKDYADYLNPKVTSYLIEKGTSCTTGIIAFDFIDESIGKVVVNCNKFD